eukprot:GSChrysophyteH1.ASY1.ANO1.2378.1 assembled CDS
MLALKSAHMSESGDSVNYTSIKNSVEYKEYCRLAKSLSTIELGSLPEHTRKGFLINVYNCLCIHALVEGVLRWSMFGISVARLKMYSSAAYNIGGHNFSLNDIEHGLLRNNSKSPAPMTRIPFAANDPRLEYCCICDPRIHFALNCGAESCPPIAVYSCNENSPDKLDKELDLAVAGFCEEKRNVNIDFSKGTVALSMLFSWYKADFASSGEETHFDARKTSQELVLDWIANHAPLRVQETLHRARNSQNGAIVTYMPYNWDLNGS